MKKLPLTLLCLFAWSLGALHAEEFRVPLPTPEEPREVEPVETLPGLDGSIVEAIRSGAPLEYINPLAPARYGSGENNVSRAPDDGRPQGFILFGFLF